MCLYRIPDFFFLRSCLHPKNRAAVVIFLRAPFEIQKKNIKYDKNISFSIFTQRVRCYHYLIKSVCFSQGADRQSGGAFTAMSQKVLILGATGAMGTYLTRKATAAGYQVDAVSLDAKQSDSPNLRYIQTKEARDPAFVDEILKNHYDIVVDFMIYDSITFRNTYRKYLNNVGQYIYTSSCRVYANEENPIRENSPRLMDVTTDPQLLFSDDYCMLKARSENALRASGCKNWTIIRPSTTYSVKRCQLLTLERPIILKHIRSGQPVLLSEPARNIPASLTWAGDVADMILGLMGNDQALGDDFNVTSSECRTWQEIADYYHDIFGLNYEWVDELTYQKFRDPTFDPETSLGAVWQLRYARMFNRAYDNSKMLRVTGLKQEQFKTLYEGLSHEKESILADD